MGGKARAEKLSGAERKGIAERAAAARWNKDVPRAIYQGVLNIGDAVIDCCVLQNGERVISQSSFLRAIGRTPNPKAGGGSAQFQKALESSETGLDEMPPFLPSRNLKPFISNDLMASTKPVEYLSSSGLIAYGYKAEILPMVCHVYEDAERAGALLRSQMHIAEAARALARAFSKTGIIALVDEATGYQYDRARGGKRILLYNRKHPEKGNSAVPPVQ